LVAPGVYESRGRGVIGFTMGNSSTTAATTSGGSIWGSTGGGNISGTASGTVSGTTNASGVSGNLRNGGVIGTIAAGGGNPTDYTGEAETAPEHIYVRCLIRAKPIKLYFCKHVFIYPMRYKTRTPPSKTTSRWCPCFLAYYLYPHLSELLAKKQEERQLLVTPTAPLSRVFFVTPLIVFHC
jgi:hypothetical protein